MILVALVIFLLALKCKQVHNYSLIVLIFVHGLSMGAQTYFITQKQEFVAGHADLNSTNQMMLRLSIPTSMIFVTRFRLFLYFVVPLICLFHIAILYWTQEFIQEEKQSCSKSPISENYDAFQQVMRDLFLILSCTIGIYLHNAALAKSFLLSKKSMKQEKQLTQVFKEQPDGLLILKEKQQDLESEDTSQLYNLNDSDRN